MRAIEAAYHFLTPKAQVQVQQALCWESRNLWWVAILCLLLGALGGHFL